MISKNPSKKLFYRFSKWTSRATGHPSAFVLATLVIFIWAVSGPYFHYSDAWQLVINTFTTLVTFLMVFLIQTTQNRDSEAVQLKLDEIIRTLEGAHNALLDIEELNEAELDELKSRYFNLARKARLDLKNGQTDTGRDEL